MSETNKRAENVRLRDVTRQIEPTMKTLVAAIETEGRLMAEAAREIDEHGYRKLDEGEFWG